jgi:hypothetical protein
VNGSERRLERQLGRRVEGDRGEWGPAGKNRTLVGLVCQIHPERTISTYYDGTGASFVSCGAEDYFGEGPNPLANRCDSLGGALVNTPDQSKVLDAIRLKPEEVLTRPRWTSHPAGWAFVALLVWGLAYALVYWVPQHPPVGSSPWRDAQPWQLVLAVAVGLVQGLLMIWWEERNGTRPQVLIAVMRERLQFKGSRWFVAIYVLPIPVLNVVGMWPDPTGCGPRGEMLAAYFVVLGVAVLPLIPFQMRVWRAAWHVVRQVNAAR